VSVAGPDDVRTGGYAYLNGRYSTPLMHWNGAAWTVAASPNVGTRANRIRGVAAVAFDDAWAVGDSQTRSLVLHWDGGAWSVVDHPTTGTYSTLWGVSASSDGGVWAVGYSRRGRPVRRRAVGRRHREQWVGGPDADTARPGAMRPGAYAS
jgi:hypothetical protein